MKNKVYVSLAIIFGIIIGVFSVLNLKNVDVNYVFWQGHSPLIIVILFSVLLGIVLTVAAFSPKFFGLRKENKKLHDQLAACTCEATTEGFNESKGESTEQSIVEEATE